MIEKEYICITCPLSCDLKLVDQDGQITVTGNTCKRGEIYANNEYTDPKRMITTTVILVGGHLPLLPVISSDVISKELLPQCIDLLYKTKVKAPVKAGDVIIPDILGSKVDIVAARSL